MQAVAPVLLNVNCTDCIRTKATELGLPKHLYVIALKSTFLRMLTLRGKGYHRSIMVM